MPPKQTIVSLGYRTPVELHHFAQIYYALKNNPASLPLPAPPSGVLLAESLEGSAQCVCVWCVCVCVCVRGCVCVCVCVREDIISMHLTLLQWQ